MSRRRCVKAGLLCVEGCESRTVPGCKRNRDAPRSSVVPRDRMPLCRVCSQPVFAGGDVHGKCRA